MAARSFLGQRNNLRSFALAPEPRMGVPRFVEGPDDWSPLPNFRDLCLRRFLLSLKSEAFRSTNAPNPTYSKMLLSP